jgi:preprotein translocase subunit SecF
MSVLTRMYRGETEFDFIAQRKRWFTVSAVVLALSILSIGIRGFDLAIDFTGGTIVEAENASGLEVADYRSALATIGEEGARVQITGDGTRVLISTEELDGQAQDELVVVVAETASVSVDDTNVDAVGATFGGEITRRAVEALLIFLVVVAGFISWRFEWKMAVAALAALAHDLIITAGIYSIVGFEVTPATVIAVLTILGYSLYDTVVVFDKITENVHELQGRNTFTEIANLSMNQVLMRSINTSLTSLLPIGSLLFVGSYLLGAATLREFALALFIGVAAGTYSSIFVATPLLAMWKETEPEWQRMQRRAARRSDDDTEGVAEVATESVDAGAVARPPRQRRKRR